MEEQPVATIAVIRTFIDGARDQKLETAMPDHLELLTPQNCQLIIIDHQPQMAFGVQSIDGRP